VCSFIFDCSSRLQMAEKGDIKQGLEEGTGNSRIRITLTCQEVKPLEKGALRVSYAAGRVSSLTCIP
jgi:hypothetical protein